jgi:hypothetical protein
MFNGIARRVTRAVPPGIDLRTHAGLSSKVPLSGTTIQANCFRCSSSIFYKPECAQVTCCECSTVILSVECSACGSFFGARVGDEHSSCPYCKVSRATSDLSKQRIESFKQGNSPRATLLHPHELHIITQVHLYISVASSSPPTHPSSQFYEDSSASRQQEIEACLFLNIRNPFIRHIHLITEKPYDFKRFGGGDKIVQHVSGKWLSYEYAFMYANKFLEDKVVLLINSDIYMDRSVQQLQHADLDNRGAR